MRAQPLYFAVALARRIVAGKIGEDALRDEDRKIGQAEAHHRDVIATACRTLIARHATTGM